MQFIPLFSETRHLRAHELSYMSRNKTLRITCEYPDVVLLVTFNFQRAPTHRLLPLSPATESEKKFCAHYQDKLQFKSNSSHWLSCAEPKRNFCVCVAERVCRNTTMHRFGSCRVRDVAKVLFYVLTLCFFLSIYGFLNFVCNERKPIRIHSE